jgi:predicted nucleic acid-binding protein
LARPLIFDSTPLIYIVRVSLSNMLRELEEPKITTTSVYNELLKGETLGKPEATTIRGLIEEKTIKLQDPRDRGFLLNIIKLAAEKEKSPLHKAEADVVALTKELGGVAISDDHVARSVARLIGIELHGTGYLLGRIYKAGRTSKNELQRKADEMRRSGWRITEEDYQKILEYVRRL